MKQRSWVGGLSAAVVLVAALVLAGTQTARLSSPVLAGPPHYQVEKLPISGKTVFNAGYLNDEGQVAGGAASYTAAKANPIAAAFDMQAALWDGKRLETIPNVSGLTVSGLNDQGQVLVGGLLAGGESALWSKGGSIRIPHFDPAAMNNRGEVVGQLTEEARDSRGQVVIHLTAKRPPCLWSRGRLTNISFGHPDIEPKSINDTGQSVGVSYQRVAPRVPSSKKQDSFDKMMDAVKSRGTIYLLNPGAGRWERTNLLDNVPPVLTPGASVDKLVINNRGQILLSLFLLSEKPIFRALLWDQGQKQDLGGKELDVAAEAMNDAGQVVGKISRVHESGWTPFIWQGGAFYDLNSLLIGKPGIKLKKIRQINDKGWILCDGEDAKNAYTLILRPVNSPPTSAAAFGVAMRP